MIEGRTRGVGRGHPSRRLAATAEKSGDVEVRRVEALVDRDVFDRRRPAVLLLDLTAGLGPDDEAGCHHRDLYLARHLLLDDGPEDDGGVLLGGGTDDLRRPVRLLPGEVGATREG